MRHSWTKLTLASLDKVERIAERMSPRRPRRMAQPVSDATARAVLVWSMDRLGDVVRSTAAIRALKQRYRDSTLTVVGAGRATPALASSPWIDELHTIDQPTSLRQHVILAHRLRRMQWDLGVLMEVDRHWARAGHWWFRYLQVKERVCFDFGEGVPSDFVSVSLAQTDSWVDQFNRLACAAGAEARSSHTEVSLTAEEREWAERYLDQRGVPSGQPFIVIHPGGNFLTVSRQWPAANFSSLIAEIHHQWGYPIVLTGVAEERPTIDAITGSVDAPVLDLCAMFSIRELSAVIERAALLISNDTGPLHLAQALGTPAVAILGPTSADVVGIASTTRVARVDISCSPCAFSNGWKACSNPVQWQCLSALTVDQVMDEIRVALAVSDQTKRGCAF